MPDVLMHSVVLIGLTDLEFKVGATLTKIKGAMELNIDGVGDTQLPKGDDRVLAQSAQKTNAKVTIKSAVLSLAARAALFGDTVAESGVTPNIIVTYEFKAGAIPEGILSGQVKYLKDITGETGTLPNDAHFIIPKFMVDPNSLKDGVKMGDKPTYDLSGTAIPDASDVIYRILLHETATPIV